MKLTINQKYKLRQFIFIAVSGLLAGFLYAFIEDGWNIFSLINGTVAGFIIGTSVAALELFVFGGSLRKIPFISIFILRVSIYQLLAFLVTFNLFVLARTFRYGLSYTGVLRSEEFQTYLSDRYHLVLVFCFLIISLVVFTLQMVRKLGFTDLLAFLTGKYHTPKREMRIFMFLSLGGSDRINNKTGNLEYHNFINDFLFDIGNSIRIHRGRVVHYKEDEVVIVWSVKAGIDNANCVRTYFHLTHAIETHSGYYNSRYGVVPKPKCAVHSGNVIRAEIGEVRSEISFFGDVVNSTSRILQEGVKRGINILVSEPLMNMIQLPDGYRVTSQGAFVPRGKRNQIQLYAIDENRL